MCQPPQASRQGSGMQAVPIRASRSRLSQSKLAD